MFDTMRIRLLLQIFATHCGMFMMLPRQSSDIATARKLIATASLHNLKSFTFLIAIDAITLM